MGSGHKNNNLHGVCNTGLGLSLGSDHHDQDINKKKPITSLKYDHLSPSDLTLGPIISTTSDHEDHDHNDHNKNSSDHLLHRQASSLSSFSNSSASTTMFVKRERDVISGEEAETNHHHNHRLLSMTTRVISTNNYEDDQDQGSPRKKLRLTKQQYALLEESFKDHSTLSPKQKQGLASQLNLRPRQVEVWFQNRRARTKLKQTEAEYEQWKKCCETLTEENKRLQKELQELKSLKLLTATLYVPFATSPPPGMVTICPSCDRISSSSVVAPQPIRLT